MKKVFVIIVASMLLTAAILLSPAAAGAETRLVEIDNYFIEAVATDLRITFGYEGELLSFYWGGQLDTSRTLFVELWIGETYIECIDAGYVDKTKRR